ncbi:MAG: hypothetical protein IPN31_06770 [Bacteroidetes bacterium]|nr:hypothetical protein [Bacteroidota bacterium]MBP8752732.1 hypothetical protein [Chitinophagales bacterium]
MNSNKNVYDTIIILWITFQSISVTYAQINPAGDNIQTGDVLEQMVESEDLSEFDYDTFLEYLDFLKANPINLNNATLTELRNTRLLSEIQIRDLLQHKKYYGSLLNIYELQTISSFTLNDINRIKPYIIVQQNNSASIQNIFNELDGGKYQIYFRTSRILQEQIGYSGDSTLSSPYLGDNYRIYTRFRYAYKNKLSYGITAEKDPGESFGDSYQPKGFDFYSAHFFRRTNGFMKSLALGDYEVRIGQGLTIFNGFGLGKSIYSIAVRRTGPVLDPYTSVDENRFLRGAAATFGSDKLQATVFGSYKKIDANVSAVDSVDSDIPSEVSSITYTGLHRTVNEWEDKDAIKELITGADITYYNPLFSIGVSGNYTKLSAPLNKDISPYEIFDFNDDELLNLGVHYSVLLRNNLFFGETAMSENKKIATINGLVLSLDPKVDISIVHRYYDRAYQSLYANAFSENSTPQNEQGLYTGFEIRPKRAIKFSGYLDMYKNPWLEYDADAPTYGTDIIMQITYQPNKIMQTYLRFKTETSSLNADADFQGEIPHDIITNVIKRNIRLHLEYKISQTITLRNRFEYVFYDQSFDSPEKGYILYQDVNYKPFNSPFAFYTRFAVFNTDSYDTRIYTYESDLLYAYSISNFSGHGTRTYIMIQYSPLRWLEFWFKIANTHYTDRNEIGSGNDLIYGNNKTDTRLQVRITW